jgi:hypothetical protein
MRQEKSDKKYPKNALTSNNHKLNITLSPKNKHLNTEHQ